MNMQYNCKVTFYICHHLKLRALKYSDLSHTHANIHTPQNLEISLGISSGWLFECFPCKVLPPNNSVAFGFSDNLPSAYRFS